MTRIQFKPGAVGMARQGKVISLRPRPYVAPVVAPVVAPAPAPKAPKK
jgi:hypothetical protein